jgi:hypothetical protein
MSKASQFLLQYSAMPRRVLAVGHGTTALRSLFQACQTLQAQIPRQQQQQQQQQQVLRRHLIPVPSSSQQQRLLSIRCFSSSGGLPTVASDPYASSTVMDMNMTGFLQGGLASDPVVAAAAAAAATTHPNGDGDDDSLYWGALMLMILLGSNVLAFWCEKNMTPNESFLQGLASINRKDDDDEEKDDKNEPSAPEGMRPARRRTTRIVHLKW